MRKALADRIKITRTGKVLRRIMGQGHFLAKKTQGEVKRKKGMKGMYLGMATIKKSL